MRSSVISSCGPGTATRRNGPSCGRRAPPASGVRPRRRASTACRRGGEPEIFVGWVELLRNPSSLPETGLIGSSSPGPDVARPILGIDAETYHSVKGRIRPVSHPRDMAVLYRIEMDVIDVAGKIVFIAQRMLPIASLPNATFASAGAACRHLLALRQVARER